MRQCNNFTQLWSSSGPHAAASRALLIFTTWSVSCELEWLPGSDDFIRYLGWGCMGWAHVVHYWGIQLRNVLVGHSTCGHRVFDARPFPVASECHGADCLGLWLELAGFLSWEWSDSWSCVWSVASLLLVRCGVVLVGFGVLRMRHIADSVGPFREWRLLCVFSRYDVLPISGRCWSHGVWVELRSP